MQTFFIPTSNQAAEYRLHVFSQIHQIVFFGQGGYDWLTVYNMPIWLRKYTFSEIRNHYDEQNRQVEKAKKTGKGNSEMIDFNDVGDKAKVPQQFRKLSK